jgi:multimeric flavodoxin WrbA
MLEGNVMKIVAVVGSIRRGNTLKMVQVACSALEQKDVDIIDLSKMTIKFCTGCLYCDETKKCNIDDDMSKVLDVISAADAYIFASPVRWSLLSGEMKTFFDRLNPFATTRTLNGRKCILLTVGQSEVNGDDASSIDAGLQSMQAFCENAGIEVIESVKAYGCLAEDDVSTTPYLDMCSIAAKKLVAALK